MAEPLSEDLRRRLIAAVEAGASRQAVAERFGVVSSTVTKLVQHVKRTGSLAPAKQGCDRRSARIETHAKEILALVAASPDITLEEIAAQKPPATVAWANGSDPSNTRSDETIRFGIRSPPCPRRYIA
jgi:transposase